MRTPENIQKHELIGLNMEVVSSKNPNNVNISGKIVNETRKTLLVESKGMLKRLFKDQITLNLDLPRKQVEIDGNLLLGRPWERLKKKLN